MIPVVTRASSRSTNAEVTVLIGMDVPEAHIQLEVRRSKAQASPMGILTPFGWTIVGTVEEANLQPTMVNPMCFTLFYNLDRIMESF